MATALDLAMAATASDEDTDGISNRIAYHISSSLNWGLASALGVILLGIVISLYLLYDKIVGIDNMKLG